MDNKTDAKSITKDIHNQRHGDSSITSNYTKHPETSQDSGTPQTGIEEIPETPQQNLVQSTSTHRHNSDQHTPIPMSEHRTVHTHGQGLNPIRPPKDESTQMPSQEALMITSDQGTQFPSQQWEHTPNSKDQEGIQHKTHIPERAVTQTSSLTRTHTADVIESHTSGDSKLTGTRDSETPETNQTRKSNNPRTVEPKHTRNDNSESDSIADLNAPNEDHATSIHITKCAQPVSINAEEIPNSNQTTGEQDTHQSRHTTQIEQGLTSLGDTKNPPSVHNEIADHHNTGNTIIKTTSRKNTPHQGPYSEQDVPKTEGWGSSMGIPSSITKVASDINSEITPIVITISENSSDDDAQVSTSPLQTHRPNQNPQEITLNSSEDESSNNSRDVVTISSGNSADGNDVGTPSSITKVASDINLEITPIVITISENSPENNAQVPTSPLRIHRPNQNPQEIRLNSSKDETSNKSRDMVTISSGNSAEGNDAEARTPNQQRDHQDQEVTILEHNNPEDNTRKHRATANSEMGTTHQRHPSTPQRRKNTHQREQSAYIGPDHNNNISIQRRRRTSHHISQDKPATTRNSCDGTLHRLIPIGKSDHPGHQIGPCYTHPNVGDNTPPDWNDNAQWSLIQTTDHQGINNFNQTPNGRLTTTSLGFPECNYCKLPSHSRQKCTFRLRDLENGIDRHQHPNKGFLTKNDAKQYKPPKKRNRSPMSTRLARETDNTGNPKFWQTQNGHIIYSMNNQPQCYYCGIPFHGRDTCPRRREDESKGVFQTYHPLRGMLYTTSDLMEPDQPDQWIGGKQETPDHIRHSEPSTSMSIINETPALPHQGTRESKDYKTKPKGGNKNRKRKHPDRATAQNTEIIILDNEEEDNENTLTDGQQYIGTPQQGPTTASTSLMDIPNEIIATITRYLSFEDNMKLRRVNKRMWQMAGMTPIWKDITIMNRPLTCSLISHAINKQTTTLNLRYCSIQGNYTKMLNLGRKLRDGFSRLIFLGLQGFKGNDILAAIIASESKELEILDLSENRYSLVGTIIGKLKENNRLKAINLSAIGGHYAEMGGLVYHPFDIHRMKPLVDKCRQLTDVILFGAKLTHEAITYFCENAPSTLLRLNLARERAYNDDIRALTKSCPHLQYLNIAETSVAYQDIINIVLAWRRTMINLCLPHRLGFVLTLRSRAPNLPLIKQFQALMNEMERMEYLHVGHYKFHQVDVEQRNPQVARLRSMFPHLKINHNPYSTDPHTGGDNIPQSDPSFQFRRNIGPNSWASRRDAETVPIVDLN